MICLRLRVGDEFLPFFPLGWVLAHPSRLFLGIPFSATLLVILLAHEMGHYLFCRYYRVRATIALLHSGAHLDRDSGSGDSH